MSFCDALELDILNHLFTDPGYTPNATQYVALSTTTPTDAGANFTEPSGNGYARVAVAAADMNAAAAGLKDNVNVLAFPTASGGSWGTVTHFGYFADATLGTVLATGALTTSRTINDGDDSNFAAGEFDVTLD